MSDQDDPFVVDLLQHAKRVASYGIEADWFDDDALLEAIRQVEALAPKTAKAQAVVDLGRALRAILKRAPTDVRSALRGRMDRYLGSAWAPSSLAKWSIVVLSVLIMLLTGRMTYIHNQGVDLAHEIESLTLVDPNRTLNQLVWDLVQAANQMAEFDVDASVQDFDLARVAHESTRSDIRMLSERISAASANATAFIRRSAFPVPGVRAAYCRLLVGDERTMDEAERCAETDVVFAGSLLLSPMEPERCLAAMENDDGAASLVATGGGQAGQGQDNGGFVSAFNEDMANTKVWLFCYNDLTIGLSSVPRLRPMLPHINERVELYAFWLLPALYGAMGAIVWHFRRVIDPMSPSPEPARFAHRVIFGGLSGIMLGWFFTPDSTLSTQLIDIGIGVFGLAFLVGYSQSILFALLDRFVLLTETGIQTAGGGQGKS